MPPSPEALRVAVAAWPRLPALPDGEPGPVAVGVSGGADSVYLLLALWADEALRPRLRVYHFDHRVRGAESAADADFVEALCRSLGVAWCRGRRDVEGSASEDELRAARNAFFAAQMAADGCRVLATAHHADDLVETMLLRLARGAGLGGLSAPRGWQVFRDGHRRWRPLLIAGLAKTDLLRALTEACIPWREDATNSQPIAARNRVRAWLRGADDALGPRHREGFLRSARILDDAQQALLVWGEELGCLADADGRLLVSPLRGRPRALAQAVLVEALYQQGVADYGWTALEPLLRLLQDGVDGQASVRGRLVRVRAGWLSVADDPAPSLGEALRPLSPGTMSDESALRAEWADVDETLWAKLSRGDISPATEVYLKVDALRPLQWRGRAEGDRYRPLGSAGTTKLSDMLINRKVPLELRDRLPVVLSGDEIVWVPGLPPAENARLHGPAKGALRLTWLGPCLGSTTRQ